MKKLINVVAENLGTTVNELALFLNVSETTVGKWATNGTSVPQRHMKRLLELHEKVYRTTDDSFRQDIENLQNKLGLPEKNIAELLGIKTETFRKWKSGKPASAHTKNLTKVNMLLLSEAATPRMMRTKTLKELSMLRRALGIPRSKVSGLLGICPQTLLCWEEGRNYPRSTTVYNQVKLLTKEFQNLNKVFRSIEATSVAVRVVIKNKDTDFNLN